MEQVIVATKQEIIEAGMNPNSKVISKCVKHDELEIMEIPKIGFVTYRYYVFLGFRL